MGRRICIISSPNTIISVVLRPYYSFYYEYKCALETKIKLDRLITHGSDGVSKDQYPSNLVRRVSCRIGHNLMKQYWNQLRWTKPSNI